MSDTPQSSRSPSRPSPPGEARPVIEARRGAAVAGGRGALLVGAGILLSRVLGLVRERVFAYFLGSSIPAAAFKAALRIPNFLQNLFGEGVLSASFIPVYARLVGRDEREEADRVAGAVFGLLSVALAVLVAAGVAVTPLFIDVVAPGFTGEARELAIRLVRILFPGTALLVLSAWCLGILNSHRRFFLSYAAPVLWNLALIATLVGVGRRVSEARLAEYVAWAAVGGSLLQFGIQLPAVLRLLGGFRPSLDARRPSVRQVLHNFGPVVLGRGVVQISAYIDTAYASLISPRALAVLAYAQTLYLLPISLFGMAVSAAELPEMAREGGSPEEVARKLRERIDQGAARIAFFVIPSAAAFLLLGDVTGGALLQTGRFGAADTRYLWYLLMGSTVGLLAATLGRLYSSAFYALHDTRTPLAYATLRVALNAVLGYWSAVKLPGQIGIPREMGAAGITAASGLAAWLEFLLLRRAMDRRIGRTRLPARTLGLLWGAAAVSAGLGLAVKRGLAGALGTAPGVEAEWHGAVLAPPALHPIITGLVVLVPFGILYFALTAAAGVPQSRAILRRLRLLRSTS